MQVIYTDWRGKDIEMSLAEALTPSYCSERGTLEDLEGTVNILTRVVGELCARMVEANMMSLGEAAIMCNGTHNIKPIEV